MSEPVFIFTIATGRCGEASLTKLVAKHVHRSAALWEEPQVHPVLPRGLGVWERHLRRRFVETHELLGRGRILDWFATGDDRQLQRAAARRKSYLIKETAAQNAEVCFDISKFFIRGLHRPLVSQCDDVRLVRLVRDPVQNMRSYTNRQKRFLLDNNRADAPTNHLKLNHDALSTEELYLWAWFENALRGDALAEEFGLAAPVEIRTDDLNDPVRMAGHFSALGLTFDPIMPKPPQNTNIGSGYGATIVTLDDIAIFERFLDRVPAEIQDRIAYLDRYDPMTNLGKVPLAAE